MLYKGKKQKMSIKRVKIRILKKKVCSVACSKTDTNVNTEDIIFPSTNHQGSVQSAKITFMNWFDNSIHFMTLLNLSHFQKCKYKQHINQYYIVSSFQENPPGQQTRVRSGGRLGTISSFFSRRSSNSNSRQPSKESEPSAETVPEISTPGTAESLPPIDSNSRSQLTSRNSTPSYINASHSRVGGTDSDNGQISPRASPCGNRCINKKTCHSPGRDSNHSISSNHLHVNNYQNGGLSPQRYTPEQYKSYPQYPSPTKANGDNHAKRRKSFDQLKYVF